VRDVDQDDHPFFFLSRFATRVCKLRELHLQSSGMGDNLLRYFEMPGRATFDWFVKLKRDLTSEPQYSLNHFAKKYCGLKKEDVDHKEIPGLFAGRKDVSLFLLFLVSPFYASSFLLLPSFFKARRPTARDWASTASSTRSCSTTSTVRARW